VSALGLSMKVESKLGEGSRFDITIPGVKPAESKEQEGTDNG
jgi:hypothetical protein